MRGPPEPWRGPGRHYARTAYLRHLIGRRMWLKRVYRFHRGCAFGGLILATYGATAMVGPAVWIGCALGVLCGFRAAWAFGKVPVDRT